MPSLYGPWSGKGKAKKKKPTFASSAPLQSDIQKAMRKVVQRRNAIVFKNMPSFEHLARGVRDTAKQQHLQWEDDLERVPIGTLHYSCSNVRDYAVLPRQTCAWLIAKYCNSKNVSIETLTQSITRANGDVKLPGLMWRREEDQRACVNLHKLDSDALYRVYCSIPDDHRPAVRPVQPKEPRPPRPSKASKGKRGHGAGLPKAQAPVVIEEQFTWVQCDQCEKWRRLFNTTEDELPDTWQCSDHPDELTCDVAEDTMDAEEQWDGTTKGTILKISFNGSEPSVQVVPPESQSTGPADSDSDDDDDTGESHSGPLNEGVCQTMSSDFVMQGETDQSELDEDAGGVFAEEDDEECDDGDVNNLFGSEDEDDEDDGSGGLFD